MKKNIFFFIFVLLLLMHLLCADTVYESYSSTIHSDQHINGSTTRFAQSFSIGNTGTNEKFNVTKVGLEFTSVLTKTLEISIKAVDSSGQPTGSDLSTGSYNGMMYGWIEVSMSAYELQPSTKYVMIFYFSDIGSSDIQVSAINVPWAEYSGGHGLKSSDSGSSWSNFSTSNDFYFYVQGLSADVTSPYFITIPNNSSLNYNQNFTGVWFNATDDRGFSLYSINDTRFIINQSGYLSNNTPLAFGNYIINVSINDTSNNINWTLHKVQVNKSTDKCQLFFNETSPLEYNKHFRSWANCTTPFKLYRNGTSIENNSEQNLSIGYYNFSLFLDDTTNYTFTFNQSQFIINDTTLPILNIINPINGESFTTGTIDLNYTVNDTGIGLDKCWYQNGTGSNITIVCGVNTTISQASDGTYNIYMWANDSFGNVATHFHTWTVSANAPAINLINPSDNKYLNYKTNVKLNFTATDSNGISTCQLWTNTTGTWQKNQTLTSVTSGVETNFATINLNEGFYKWNVWCNDSTGLPSTDSWATINKTFTIDTSSPDIIIDSITTTAGSQTISFNSTEDDININTCKYSIYNSSGGIDGTNENVSMTCNSNPHSATTTDYGDFTLRVYGVDKSLNENYTELNFTTSASTGVIILGGGGGASTVEEAVNYSITSVNYLNKIDISLAKKSVKPRTKNFFITNKGSQDIELELKCDATASTTGINICDYVTIKEEKVTISPNENDPYLGSFEISTPENASIGDAYYFNILAYDGSEYSKLSVSAKVGYLGYIYKYSYLNSNTNLYYSVGLVAFVFAVIGMIIMILIFAKMKLYLVGFYSGILSFFGIFFLSLVLL